MDVGLAITAHKSAEPDRGISIKPSDVLASLFKSNVTLIMGGYEGVMARNARRSS